MPSIENRIATIEERVAAIEERNLKVETDKAWETSLTRRGAIILVTYVIATLTFAVIGTEAPYVMAVIPTLGYLLSTLALPPVRKHWLRVHQVQSLTSASLLQQGRALMSQRAPDRLDAHAGSLEDHSLRGPLKG